MRPEAGTSDDRLATSESVAALRSRMSIVLGPSRMASESWGSTNSLRKASPFDDISEIMGRIDGMVLKPSGVLKERAECKRILFFDHDRTCSDLDAIAYTFFVWCISRC